MNRLQSLLEEHRTFTAPEAFSANAHLNLSNYQALVDESEQDPDGFWGRLAREHLHWHIPFTQVLDARNAPFYRWFHDGTLNVSHNCLDRHMKGAGKHKAALIWEGENGESLTFTYAQLHREVSRCANMLLGLGIGKGDRVAVYLPMIPEAVITMLACARIGAIHTVIFGGFSSDALLDRLHDTHAKALITSDGGYRGGKTVPLKAHADTALIRDDHPVEHVIVVKRTGQNVDMMEGRDLWWHDLMQAADVHCPPASVNAEHPLFILYTSGSTGKPKGIVHASGGYLLWATLTMQWVFDIKPEDVFWCTADVGWITGHTYLVYGPLSNGATVFMYEGTPTYPHAGRFWELVEKHGVNTLYTAPTAIRALMRLGDQWPEKYDLSSLRLLGTVGEPINPEAWIWFHEVIGKGRCPIVDTWWQTETGGHMIAPLPAVTPLKPGSCTRPLPGIKLEIVDDHGDLVHESDKGGYLVAKRPWPSMLRGVWGNEQRYLDSYWEKFDRRYYVAGDSGRRDSDGYYWVMGRIDDVLNVSGHRLGTAEIESALVSHPAVAEAAVVGKPHEIKGEAICAFVILKHHHMNDDRDELRESLRIHVADVISPIAKPDDLRIVEALPKTRSGKIMRRILRAQARGEEITQDLSTLENEEVLQTTDKP